MPEKCALDIQHSRSRFLNRSVIVGVAAAWLLPAAAALGGIVSLVSQDRFVSVVTPPADGGSTPQTQTVHAPDFGVFNQTLNATVPGFGQSAHAFQSSTLTLTGGGAVFSANGGAAVDNIMAGAGGQSSFQVVFDISAPIEYTLNYDQSNSVRFPPSTARFDGPSGLGQLPAGLPGGFSGTLTAGEYTLSAVSTSGSSFDLTLNVSPSSSAVPVPPAAWTASGTIALLASAGIVTRRRRQIH